MTTKNKIDLIQQLMDVDKKAREQEKLELIHRFYNLGVSVAIIANATDMGEDDISKILND
ncbi:hypothetical protein ACMHYP_23195 [Bacillus cereus]|uniref:hypothetical protein n=1 Tax=Bacillus cereus group TaxID=86661 RepID=UPI0030147F70